VNAFARIARKKSRLVVGLMSGTSADGIDAALVRIRGGGRATRVETLAALTVPFAKDVRAAIHGLATGRAADVARWNMTLGEMFADAALAVVARAKRSPRDVDLIGSHGQTIVHLPRARGGSAATLQIGEPCVIAERTGIPVVADFRARDVAAGGEGAPLVPLVDWILLRPTRGARLAQNLGGVGNVTLVTPRARDVVAFDTGPANAPIDAAVALATNGRRRFDEGGRLAASGRVAEDEVARMLRDPWFRRPPPKSLDRDAFGATLVADLVRRRPDLAGADLVATMTEFVARTVADAYRRHLPARARIVDVVVSGGGVHNPVLMRRLRELLAPTPVRSSAELGIDPDAKEAVAFAVLANESVAGRAGSLPRVTGARRGVVLGKFVP
jgi:anhydro-N-acetylmuramic acid kinase